MSYIGAKPTTAEYYYDAFSGDGVRDTFTCTIEPASPVSAIVAISGYIISPEDYYFDGTFIKFATPPVPGTKNIQIRYLAVPASGIAAPKTFRQVAEYYATEGQTLFTVQRYDLGYIDVFVNGVQLGNLDYQASDGENVILQVPARENDLIRVVTAYNTLLARQVINATPNAIIIGNGLNPLKELPLGSANTFIMANGNNWISQSSVFNYAGYVTGNVLPTNANTFNLGSPDRPFKSLYLANSVSLGGNSSISLVDGEISFGDTNIALSGDINVSNVITSNVTTHDLYVTGNLTVLGTSTTLSTSTLQIDDSLLYLAGNNYTSDVLDIGFVGHHGDSNSHTGFFRSATNKEYYLFSTYDPEVESNNNIDIAHATFSTANLNARFVKANLIGSSVSVSGTASAPYITNATAFTGSSMRVDYLGVGVSAGGILGEIRAANDVVAFYTSDIRNKENIKDIEDSLNKVITIGGKTFDWKDSYINQRGGEDDYFVRKSDFGVIAQDVEKVFPLAVHKKMDGTLAVDYVKLIALAFAAIKELKEEIDELKGK